MIKTFSQFTEQFTTNQLAFILNQFNEIYKCHQLDDRA